MREVAQRLAPGGQFVFMAYNPARRSRSMDGRWKRIRRFTDDAGRRIEVHVRETLDRDTSIVTGEQRILVCRGGAIERDHVVPIRGALPSHLELRELGAQAGLATRRVFGNYDRGPYEERTSEMMVVVMERV